MSGVHERHWIALVVLLAAAVVEDAHAAVSLAIEPDWNVVAPGTEFTVEVVVPEAGAAFNGYDAVVGYDPSRLTLELPLPYSQWEGSLFTSACAQRFLRVQVAPDSSSVTISHVLLCAGTRVTGPGTTFLLRFRARGILGQTYITLLDGSAFYDGGDLVEPLTTRDARIWIGDPSDSPEAPRAARLIAVPNPFNPNTELRYEFSRDEHARVDIFDVAGRHIDRIFDGRASSGPFRLPWDGRDARGRLLSSGVYFARLTTPDGTRALTRMVLVR